MHYLSLFVEDQTTATESDVKVCARLGTITVCD